MESSLILSTAMDIIRKSMVLRSTSTLPHVDIPVEDFVMVESEVVDPVQPNGGDTPPLPVSFMNLATEYSEFAGKYPHLFRMCIDTPSAEHAENLIRILPMMLRQRDGIHSGGEQMESATAKIVESLNQTYIDHLNLPKKSVNEETSKKMGKCEKKYRKVNNETK